MTDCRLNNEGQPK